jgi:N-acyl-D-amino-acid deacylase
VELDLLISGGKLIDGTGAPWRWADVGISGDRVVALGRLGDARARRRIDATGHFVCPGFIDMHSHADLTLLAGRWVDLRLLQGITTEVVGQDGLSYAPASPAHLQEWRRYLVGLNGDFPEVRWDWASIADLMARYQGRAANVVYLIPHGAVRVETMGWEDRPASSEELRAMQVLVRRGLEEGAAGLSTGLSYAPCSHATTEEMVALCRPVAEAGGLLSIHLRSYIADFMPAIDEAIEIGRRSGVAVQISHLRMCDPATWGQAQAVLERLERGRGEGVDITFDLYPYTMGSAPLFAMLPGWAQSGGPDRILARLNDPGSSSRIMGEMRTWSTDWPAFVLSNARPTELGDWTGHSLTEAAAALGMDVLAFILRLLASTELDATIVADGGNEKDNAVMFAHPAAMVSSDGIMIGGRPHPRGYGAFPRVLAHMVRGQGSLRWEEAIQKMTGLPAAGLGLHDRGVLRPGAVGDVVVLSPEEIHDRATSDDGRRPPSGIKWVLVNGGVVVDNGLVVRMDQGKALCPLLKRRVM